MYAAYCSTCTCVSYARKHLTEISGACSLCFSECALSVPVAGSLERGHHFQAWLWEDGGWKELSEWMTVWVWSVCVVSSVAGRSNVACTSLVVLVSAVVYNGLKSYMPTKDLDHNLFSSLIPYCQQHGTEPLSIVITGHLFTCAWCCGQWSSGCDTRVHVRTCRLSTSLNQR